MSSYRYDRKHLRVSCCANDLFDISHQNRYCPGGPDSDFDYSTQSYTGYEPTSMRAIRARYDPYEQTRNRVEQLKALGHSVDKVSAPIIPSFSVDDLLSGGVYYHGGNIYEHAGGLSLQIRRSTTQRLVRIHRT